MLQPAAELKPAPLYAAVLLAALLCAIAAALASSHPLPLRAALLLAVAALLAKAWQDEVARGLRRLAFSDDEGTVVVHYADGRSRHGRYAGHALLGSFVVFVFIERSGWRRVFGPERLAISRDATDADSFRRLRARVRLGA